MQWLAISQIKSADAGRRLQAIESLRESRDVKAILALIGALMDPVPRVRVAAAQTIGGLKNGRCVQPLLAVLRDPEPRVREAAVLALKTIGHNSSIPYLVPLLSDPAANVRAHAAHALRTLGWVPETEVHQAYYFIAAGQYSKAAFAGAAAVEPLLAALIDESGSKRRAVAEALSEIDDPRATAAVARLLDDADSGVRLAAIVALGRTGDIAHVPRVLKQFEHPDKNVRAAALETLAKLKHPDLFSILVVALQDPHWNVRAVAAAALGRSGESRAVEPLLGALREADADVRQIVAEAIGRLGDPGAIEPLILAHLDPDTRVRQAIHAALCQIHPDWPSLDEAKRSLPALKRALKESDYAVRQTAADLLNRIFNIRQCEPTLAADVDAETAKRRRAMDVLTSILWDDDPLLRFAGVWGLHQIGDARAVAPLSAKLKDGDEFVRRAAERALVQFGIAENTRAVEAQALRSADGVWGRGATT